MLQGGWGRPLGKVAARCYHGVMADLHISLLSCALAALIAVWLGFRCGVVRRREDIMHGHGGNPLLERRMRAQANFTEYTPFVLLLVLVLDLLDRDGWALGLTALAYLLGRVAHGIGMDAPGNSHFRFAGMLLTWPVLIGLAAWAGLVGLGLA